MSVHIKENNSGNKHLEIDGYDVRIVGGKRLIIPKGKSKTLTRYEQNAKHKFPTSQSWSTVPSPQHPHKISRAYRENSVSKNFESASLSAPAASTSFNNKSILPAIVSSARPSRDTNLHNNHQTYSQPKTDDCEVDEILLKYSLGKALESTKEDTLNRLKTYLELKNSKNTSVRHPDEIIQEFQRFKVNIPENTLKLLFSKHASDSHPGFIEIKKLMAYLIRVKKLPVLDVPPLQHLARNHKRKRPQIPFNAFRQFDRSQLRQEEMPILTELKSQLQNVRIDLPNLVRQFNEVDRERMGVLTRNQIEKVLRRNNINLTENLLNVMLYYCDKDGYRLYSTTKFLSYFDLVVKEDRSLIAGNRNVNRLTRVKSPTPPFTPPRLEQNVDDFSTYEIQDEINGGLDLEYESPLDRNEWLYRFNSMASALSSAQKDLPGFLPTEEVQHIAETYNTVYNLQIPQMLIGLSIARAYNHRHLQVDINEFVNHLQRTSLQQIAFTNY